MRTTPQLSAGEDAEPTNVSAASDAGNTTLVSRGLSGPDPAICTDQRTAQTLGRASESSLLAQRKLILVVDLDQTVIHTTEERVCEKIQGVYQYRLRDCGMNILSTRLRPGTEKFLDNMSKLFEMQIFTMGSRPYAHQIASILDPEKKYFGDRITSRDDCARGDTKLAKLRRMYPEGDRMISMIDDRTDVWESIPSLIPVKPYSFFHGIGDLNGSTNSAAGLNTVLRPRGRIFGGILSNADSLAAGPGFVGCLQDLFRSLRGNTDGVADYVDSDDHLEHLEYKLRRIHQFYFETCGSAADTRAPDLKDLIPRLRRRVLADVVVVLTGFRHNSSATARLISQAVSLGAKVQRKLSCEVTHLIAARPGASKLQMVVKFPSVQVVTRDWINSCAEKWERSPETLFTLGHMKRRRLNSFRNAVRKLMRLLRSFKAPQQ